MERKKLKEGEPHHIKGFILNKLYLGGFFAKQGKGHHGKHTSIDNLAKGYNIKYRGGFPKIIQELKKDGFILIFPSSGEKHVCAILDAQKIERGLVFVNEFRNDVGLLPLGPKFREVADRKK
jgi:hypothetical protein